MTKNCIQSYGQSVEKFRSNFCGFCGMAMARGCSQLKKPHRVQFCFNRLKMI